MESLEKGSGSGPIWITGAVDLIDKQANECYYSMLANTNRDCICLMQKRAIKRFYAAKSGVFFY